MLNTTAVARSNRDSTRDVYLSEAEPGPRVAEIAALLRRSWRAPSLLYSEQYVRWQLTFPGALRPRVLIASDGLHIIGAVAAVPRRVVVGSGAINPLPVLTFFVVDPDYRGEGFGRRLAHELLEMVATPMFLYTEPTSAVERTFEAAAVARGACLSRVASMRTYARGGPSVQGENRVAAHESRVDEFLSAIDACPVPDAAWSRPTREQAAHYAADPRGCCLATVRGPEGALRGAALIVRSHLVTARGTERAPSLDAVWIDANDHEALAALGAFAMTRWPVEGAAVVTAPSLQSVAPDTIRRAGFRATRASFNLAVLYDDANSWVQGIAGSNLEVF